MERLIINPLSNYEMVKTNETCAAGFLMSRFPLPESLIASARVMFLEAHADHETVFQYSPEDVGEDERRHTFLCPSFVLCSCFHWS